MPGALGAGLVFIIFGAILVFLSLAVSGMIARRINDGSLGDDEFVGLCIFFCFLAVVIFFVIFFSRGNALPEFLLRPLLWLLGWPEPHKMDAVSSVPPMLRDGFGNQ